MIGVKLEMCFSFRFETIKIENLEMEKQKLV